MNNINFLPWREKKAKKILCVFLCCLISSGIIVALIISLIYFNKQTTLKTLVKESEHNSAICLDIKKLQQEKVTLEHNLLWIDNKNKTNTPFLVFFIHKKIKMIEKDNDIITLHGQAYSHTEIEQLDSFLKKQTDLKKSELSIQKTRQHNGKIETDFTFTIKL